MPSQSTTARRLNPPVIFVPQRGWVRVGGMFTTFVLEVTAAQSSSHSTFIANSNPNEKQTRA